jgi:hypothetical protein
MVEGEKESWRRREAVSGSKDKRSGLLGIAEY